MPRITLPAALIAACLTIAPAWAHAVLKSSSPAAGSAAHTAPREVVLSFSEKLEPAFSRATVEDLAGARVDRGKSRVAGDQIRVSLRALAPGTYRVRWRVVSVDTHASEGDFTFRVGE